MSRVLEIYAQLVAMQHARMSWQNIASRLEELAGDRAIARVLYEVAFDTGEIIRFDGIDWQYGKRPEATDGADEMPTGSEPPES
ncbi:MAG TPA: hypothetical protein VE650_21335 [Acetobacteraceae bacterium]|nr:hypothetical protein [Acetobacteraceae bacterium]